MNIHSVTFATVCREMVPPQYNQAVLGGPEATGASDNEYISILEEQFGWVLEIEIGWLSSYK
jgi:hypothetical protein